LDSDSVLALFDYSVFCIKMKVKEAIQLLSSDEQKALGHALKKLRYGNQPSLHGWYMACLKLSAKQVQWGEADLMREMGDGAENEINRGSLRQRTTQLVKCIEQFLVELHLAMRPASHAQFLVEELRLRDCGPLYLTTFKKAVQSLETTPFKSFVHHSSMLAMQDEFLHSPLASGAHDFTSPLFQQSLDALDRAYALKKLSLACKAMSQDRDRSTHHRLSFMDELLTWTQSVDPQDEPLIYLYSQLYTLIVDAQASAPATYARAKESLMACEQALKAGRMGELEDVCTYLINYCVLALKNGRLEFRDELVAIYDWVLREGVLETQGKIKTGNFRNAFLILSKAENQPALDRLVSQYGDRVEGDTAKATVCLCRGLNALTRAQYESAETCFESAIVHIPFRADDRLEAETRGLSAYAAFARGGEREAKERLQGLGRLLGKGRLAGTYAPQLQAYSYYLRQLVDLGQLPVASRQDRLLRLDQTLRADPEKIFGKKWLLKGLASLMQKKR
jgi:hypothetical protein